MIIALSKASGGPTTSRFSTNVRIMYHIHLPRLLRRGMEISSEPTAREHPPKKSYSFSFSSLSLMTYQSNQDGEDDDTDKFSTVVELKRLCECRSPHKKGTRDRAETSGGDKAACTCSPSTTCPAHIRSQPNTSKRMTDSILHSLTH